MGHPPAVAGLLKAIMGFARLFRPTYALANVGHPSCSRESASTQALQRAVWKSSSAPDTPGLGQFLDRIRH
jgi:hypothetical protein